MGDEDAEAESSKDMLGDEAAPTPSLNHHPEASTLAPLDADHPVLDEDTVAGDVVEKVGAAVLISGVVGKQQENDDSSKPEAMLYKEEQEPVSQQHVPPLPAPTAGQVAERAALLNAQQQQADLASSKRPREEEEDETPADDEEAKKVKIEQQQLPGEEAAFPADGNITKEKTAPSGICLEEEEPSPVEASNEPIHSVNDIDVLSGRGGGTNVHPGNIKFRDLIQQHRRAYLKARKNDKPSISRMIVRVIRQQKGRFLKKDEMACVWLEIGDDAAREKTSQALRQRAPEVRKLMYDAEREDARMAQEEQYMRHQQQRFAMMGAMGGMDGAGMMGMHPGMGPPMMFAGPAFFMAPPMGGAGYMGPPPPGMAASPSATPGSQKPGLQQQQPQQQQAGGTPHPMNDPYQYQQAMFHAAVMSGMAPRFSMVHPMAGGQQQPPMPLSQQSQQPEQQHQQELQEPQPQAQQQQQEQEQDQLEMQEQEQQQQQLVSETSAAGSVTENNTLAGNEQEADPATADDAHKEGERATD